MICGLGCLSTCLTEADTSEKYLFKTTDYLSSSIVILNNVNDQQIEENEVVLSDGDQKKQSVIQYYVLLLCLIELTATKCMPCTDILCGLYKRLHL